MKTERIHRLALTGGPGAGKTTAAHLLRREIGEEIVVVPEAATMIFSGGFPRYESDEARRATQATIYNIQKNLEDVQSLAFPNRTLLCDRGTLDSAVYWPNGQEDFFKSLDTTIDKELQRYDAVIFFQSAAVGNVHVIEGGNPCRQESIAEAAKLDARLHDIWSKHDNFFHIPHQGSFLKKINLAIETIQKVIGKRS